MISGRVEIAKSRGQESSANKDEEVAMERINRDTQNRRRTASVSSHEHSSEHPSNAPKVSAMRVSKTQLKAAMHGIRTMVHQIVQSTPETKSVINQIYTCLIEQELTPSSLYSIAMHKAYTRPSSKKGIKLTKAEKSMVHTYLHKRAAASNSIGLTAGKTEADNPITRRSSQRRASVEMAFDGSLKEVKLENHGLAQVTLPVLSFGFRSARRTAARARLPPKTIQSVIHFNNLLHDHNSTFSSIMRILDDNDSLETSTDMMENLSEDQIASAVEFIDSLGNGDGEVELSELRMAFRRARQLVNQVDPEAKGRVHVQKLAKAFKFLNLTTEGFFESMGLVQDPNAKEELGVGQMQLFKALRHMSESIQAKLGPKDRFAFSDDCILEMMTFIDPNADGTTTLTEITEGLEKADQDPGQNKKSAAAAAVLKKLEKAMIAEGGDLAVIFAEIDKDGSGSVNSEELGEALSEFHYKRLKELQQSHSDMFNGLSQKEKDKQNIFNHTYNLHTASKSKTEYLNIVSRWMLVNRIEDSDMSLKDVENFMNWVDPHVDNEITASEMVDALNELVANGSGGLKNINGQSSVVKGASNNQIREPGVYDDFAAGKVVARVFSALYYRKIPTSKLFSDAVDFEIRQHEEDEQARLQAEVDGVEHVAREKMPHVLDQHAFAQSITGVLDRLIGEDCDDAAPVAAGSVDAAPTPSNIGGSKALQVQCLKEAVTDVCNIANRTIDIFSYEEIVDAVRYFGLVDRHLITLYEVSDAFVYCTEEQMEDTRLIEGLKLCRKFQHALARNGHTINALFDKVLSQDDHHKSSKKEYNEDHAPTVHIISFVQAAMLDQGEQDRHTVLLSPIAVSRAKEVTEIAEQLKEKRLHELTSGVGDEEIVANVTVSKPPRPPWKDLLVLKAQLLAKLKKKSAVRISATLGFVDAVHEAKNRGKLTWVPLYTGQADELNIDDAVDVLLAKARPLTAYTLRTQNIDSINGKEILKNRHFVVFVTAAEAPVIVDSGVRELQVEWPKIDTKKLGDIELNLSLEVCTGRKWASGKVRQSANTLSLLTSAGKKSFRTVYTEQITRFTKLTASRRGAKKVKVTDLHPACWYHVRFRVDYKLVEPVVDEEYHDDDFIDIHAVGRGRAFGGVRSTNTEPDVPEPPEMPRATLDYVPRILPMGASGSASSKTKVTLKVSWVPCVENGYEIKYYILQMRTGKPFFEDTVVKRWEEGDNGRMRDFNHGLQISIQGSVNSAESYDDAGQESSEERPEGHVDWSKWTTCYSNKFEQFYVKAPPLGTVAMEFRLCAASHMGASPWGDTLHLSGGKFDDFFSSGTEAGPGSVGNESGLDVHHLKSKQKALMALSAKKDKEGDDGMDNSDDEKDEEKKTEKPARMTLEEKNNLLGKTKRERLAKEEKEKVVAFGRAVKDEFDVFGGGKMVALTLTGDTLPAISKPREQSGEKNALDTQFDRNADIIRNQIEFPVSMSAARLALMKVTTANKEIITRLPSSRLSPSPVNYLQKIRDDREMLGMMRYPEEFYDMADISGMGGSLGRRPVTAPNPPSSTVLTEKWLLDAEL
jgi:hypothetical protein